jgi:hypothetical protein
MPRNVRNFWIEINVDGASKTIATGPRNANGGFSMTIYQRDKGTVSKALRVDGRVNSRGELVLTAGSSTDMLTVETPR